MEFDLAATDVNLAWIYYNLGRNEDALKSLNQTIESHSELLHISWEVHALKGLIYKSLGKNIAIGSFKKSVEILERIRGETF